MLTPETRYSVVVVVVVVVVVFVFVFDVVVVAVFIFYCPCRDAVVKAGSLFGSSKTSPNWFFSSGYYCLANQLLFPKPDYSFSVLVTL